jgi:hypothetical protein
MFTSMFVLRRDEPKCLGQKDISVNLGSEVPLEEKDHGISQRVI